MDQFNRQISDWVDQIADRIWPNTRAAGECSAAPGPRASAAGMQQRRRNGVEWRELERRWWCDDLDRNWCGAGENLFWFCSTEEVSEAKKNVSEVWRAREPEVVASIQQILQYMLNHIFRAYSKNLAIPISSHPLNQTSDSHFFNSYL
jgi:hypothetical protein